jgi:hypothetical protein
VRSAGDTPELLLDVDAAGLQSALQWLSKYKLRRKLQLTDVNQQYSVWTAFEGQLQAGGAGGLLLLLLLLLLLFAVTAAPALSVCLQNQSKAVPLLLAAPLVLFCLSDVAGC